MSAIFISHSSQDVAEATRIGDWLAEQGHHSVFLDFHPEQGIPAGRDWEQELYAQLRSCQAVIVLCSRASMASSWCFAEITHAKALGKAIFPVRIDDCEVNSVLMSRQVVELADDRDDGLDRLARGLQSAGLDPADSFQWDGSRPPYPGLMSFQEEDAAVFFGRESLIQQGIERLNRLHQFGGARLLMVLGASGSGKSSLVRAGLIPRLRRDQARWIVVDPFRPGSDPLRELAAALARTMEAHRQSQDWRELAEVLSYDAGAPRVDGAKLNAAARDLLTTIDAPSARVLLILDQTEELFGDVDAEKAHRFLAYLAAALGQRNTPLMLVGTLRSDFLGDFQQHPALRDSRFEPLHVGPLPIDGLVQVIEGPAEIGAIRLGEGLTDAMVKDTETEDALPLLAFTLRELYERYGDDKLLEVSEYRDGLGGLAGSVATAANAVFDAVPLSDVERAALRKSFLDMVRVTDDGQFARSKVSWAKVPEVAHVHLERFVQARLLVSRTEGDERILEVTHEALLRSWDRLRVWLEEDLEFLLWRRRMKEAEKEWDRLDRDSNELLAGPALAEAIGWFERKADALSEDERTFVEKSRQAEEARRRRLRNRLVGTGGFLVLVALGGFGLWQRSARAEAQLGEALDSVGVVLQQRAAADSARFVAEAANTESSVRFAWRALEEDVMCENSGSVMDYGARHLYCQIAPYMDLRRLQGLSGLPVYVSGPHDDFQIVFDDPHEFAHYNPAFVRWAVDHLIPASADSEFRELSQPIYDRLLLSDMRAYERVYEAMDAHRGQVDSIRAAYVQHLVDSADQEGLNWYNDAFAATLRPFSHRVMLQWSEVGGMDSLIRLAAFSFWIRRELDGTADLFHEGLEKLLGAYDPEFATPRTERVAATEPLTADPPDPTPSTELDIYDQGRLMYAQRTFLENLPCSPVEARSTIGEGIRGIFCRAQKAFPLGTLAQIAGQPVFVEGPHEFDIDFDHVAFGHYNPAFVRWAHEALLPSEGTDESNAVAVAYRTVLRRTARIYYDVERALAAQPERADSIARAYQGTVQMALLNSDGDADPWAEIQPALRPFVSGFSVGDQPVALTAAGFWMRRTVDGSRPEFRIGLEKLLRQFDPEYLDH